jgi:hypothetical protein
VPELCTSSMTRCCVRGLLLSVFTASRFTRLWLLWVLGAFTLSTMRYLARGFLLSLPTALGPLGRFFHFGVYLANDVALLSASIVHSRPLNGIFQLFPNHHLGSLPVLPELLTSSFYVAFQNGIFCIHRTDLPSYRYVISNIYGLGL